MIMRNDRKSLRCLAIATAFAAWPSFTLAEGGQDFGSWQAYCDAQRNCTLETFQFEGGPTENLLFFERGLSDPDWRLMVWTGASGPLSSDVTVSVDGLDFRFSGDEFAIREHEPSGTLYQTDIILGGSNAQAVLDELQLLGDRVKVSFRDGEGRSHAAHFWIPVFTEALEWVDGQQGREGRPHTAGTGTGTSVTHTARAAAVPPEVLELRNYLGHCEPLADLQHGEHLIAADDLGDGTALYVLPCSGGGFNLSYVIYHDSGGEISPRWLVDYSDEESWFATPDLFNVEWDARERTLRTFRKGRSIGDCGSVGEWRYGDMGLRLERFSYQGECDGSVPPGEFPLIFEAKPAPVCALDEPCD